MNRRRALALSAAAPAILTAKARRMNLLFLMSDQHQREASGCYGHREVKTPHIDGLAATATRFDRTYCNSPVCVPARGSLVTGLYAHRHGARILRDALPDEIPTIGHFHRERGYATAAIGKMHFVDETRRHGFDHRLHEGDFQATLSESGRKRLREDQGGAEGFAGRASKLEGRYFQDNWYADKAVEFLHANKGKPFCLWASFFMPHTPLVPAREFFDLYDPARLKRPERRERDLEGGFEGHWIRARERGWYGQTDEALGHSLAGYYGNISQMDRCVGRVFNALRELGLDKDTVVVYTSDHGEMAGAHRMWTKHNMFEQSVAVPLLISAPERIRSREARRELVEHVDLFPTLAELTGHSAPAGVHGRSFAALLEGRRYKQREFAYSEYWFCHNVFTRDDRYVGKDPIRMVRTADWKLNRLEWGKSELFDLRRDPGEFVNRSGDRAAAGVERELTAIARRMAAA